MTKSHFQIVVFFCVLLVLGSVTLAMWLMPKPNGNESDKVSFEQQKFNVDVQPESAKFDFLKNSKLQRIPPKTSSKQTKSNSKTSAPKQPVPSDSLQMKGVFFDSEQPMNAVALIKSNSEEKWLGIGEKLNGRFSAWSIQSITDNSVRFVFGDKTDSIPLTIDE